MMGDQNKQRYRHGHTLVELMVSMVSASMLLTGLASCLFIALRAFDGSSGAAVRSRAAEAQAEMLIDLGEATSFSNRDVDSVSFTVPDRDGDGDEETIAYSWASATKELSYSYNGSPNATLLEDVTNFQLGYKSRFMPGAMSAPPPYDSNDWGARWQSDSGIVFEEFVEKQGSNNDDNITIDAPGGTADGNLLVAAVVVDGNETATLAAPGGWNLIVVEHRYDTVTFGVWWKIASASEAGNYTFTWSSSVQAYGWIMRFTGHSPVNPIDDWALLTTGSGDTLNPPSPAVTTTVNNAMILRLGGFDDDDINVGDPGLPAHTAINMKASKTGNGRVSGGSGYVLQAPAGDSGQSTFALTDMEQTVAITIAIAPE